MLLCLAKAATAEPVPLRLEGGVFAGTQVNRGGEMANVPESSAAFGIRLGLALSRRFTLEGEASAAPTHTRGTSSQVILIGLRGQVLLNLRTTGRFVPFVAAGGGAMMATYADPFTDQGTQELLLPLDSRRTDYVVGGGLGFKFFVTRQLGLRLDARSFYSPSASASAQTSYELLAGAYGRFGADPPPPRPRDGDRDAVPLGSDWCPDQAEDKDGFHDDDGCPDPDNDDDKIADAQDKCPSKAEDANGVDDEDGCPEADPAQEVVAAVEPEAAPDPAQADPDSDSVPAASDNCPDAAEDADGFQDDDGCPDPDNDGDGFADASDACAGESETRNGYKDGDGCPDEVPAEVAKLMGSQAREGIFGWNKATTLPKVKVLDKLAVYLHKYPSAVIEVLVFTSGRGKLERRLAFSRRRAEAVRVYLAAKGIDEDRIRTGAVGPPPPPAEFLRSLRKDDKPRIWRPKTTITIRMAVDSGGAPAGPAPTPS